jgi:hypothetical protein
MCLSLKQYLSVADNARDAVLLHVSDSSERQEQRNETGAMTKTTNAISEHAAMPVVILSCAFIQQSIW